MTLEPEDLKVQTRTINQDSQIVVVFRGGGLYVEVLTGGAGEKQIRGAMLRVYHDTPPTENRKEIASLRLATEPTLGRIINVTNHLLNKRLLHTYKINLDMQVEAASPVEAREAVKSLFYFSDRDALADWDILRVEEQGDND